jgi:hypothetical protein
MNKGVVSLSVSLENCRVPSLPVGPDGWSVLRVFLSTSHQSSVLAASRRLSAALSVFLCWIADPVDARIPEKLGNTNDKQITRKSQNTKNLNAHLWMALWNGSTRITSKNLNVASSLTQYELSTRRLPHRLPMRPSAIAWGSEQRKNGKLKTLKHNDPLNTRRITRFLPGDCADS